MNVSILISNKDKRPLTVLINKIKLSTGLEVTRIIPEANVVLGSIKPEMLQLLQQLPFVIDIEKSVAEDSGINSITIDPVYGS